MPSLIDLRRRIRSVKNTEQITKAMKMVSAAKLRRAQERVIAARPVRESDARNADRYRGGRAIGRAGVRKPVARRARSETHRSHLFLERHGPRGRLQFEPAQSLAEVLRRIIAGAQVTLTLVGRKGRDFYRRRDAKILAEYINLAARPAYQDATAIAREVIRRYRDGETDAVFVLNNEFKSVMSQKLSVMQLLPVV